MVYGDDAIMMLVEFGVSDHLSHLCRHHAYLLALLYASKNSQSVMHFALDPI